MRKSIIAVVFILMAALQSCGQGSNAKKESMNQNIKEKYLNSYKLIKKYDYNPRFLLDFESYNCTYEILVNDMPALVSFTSGNQGGAIVPVSSNILKSGKQDITIRVYPRVDDNDKMDTFLLAHNSGLNVKIKVGDYEKEKQQEYKQLFQYKMPEVQIGNIPYVEFKGSFEANVPYQLKGWSQSQDLRKENKEQLTKEVVAFYQRYRELLAKGDMDAIAALLYPREVEVEQAFFFNKPADAEDTWKRFDEIRNYHLEMEPLEHYELRFYGDGRAVGLVRTDDELRGESAMVGTSSDGKYRIYNLILHKPAGSSQLQVIR
jgi:hypothetical protein